MAETCYRHPDRETGVSCSRCGRPICHDCMTPAPVGMHCPECAGERTRVHSGAGSASGAALQATYALIAVNVVVFLAQLGGGGGDVASVEGGGTLIRDGGLFGPAIADGGEWWRIVTSGFLHAGPLHLLLNMFVLYILGSLLEPAIGSARLVGLYVASLLGGALGALILTPDSLTVGASGAVYGLMGAAVLIARQRGVEQVASQIGLWLVLNLAFTFSVPGISIGGHLGGLAVGALGAILIARIAVVAGGRQAFRLELASLAALSLVVGAGALIAAHAASGPAFG